MSHPRLAAVSLMCIESELLGNLDFTIKLIEEFATQKSRQIILDKIIIYIYLVQSVLLIDKATVLIVHINSAIHSKIKK